MSLMKISWVLLVFIYLGFFVTECVYSQTGGTQNEEERSEGEAIILSPAADILSYQAVGDEEYSSLTGLIFGNGIFGFETIYRQPGARADLGLSLSFYYDAGSSTIRDNNLLIGGLSVGRTITISDFSNSAGRKKLEIYFRIAPGFGVAGRGIIENGSMQYFPGITATTEFGAIYHFTDRVSLFTNAGGRYYWFPGLDEIGLLGRPAVMLGLQFNFTGGFSMVRF